ncbi:FAD-binding protein [Brachybacterium sp. EF45031]|uniref:D-arabinono-1,4-lactone oxidase n=1 Tax=Brachybacterium sillae TaxID=2810536 RepID=UPI00217D5CD7|nr:D-arabinono-1,4-lactone oxidase [Brachybacterium sillae]MCS6712626.1 FAD-binding protein [Brachybacterium sillae]
MTTLPTRNWSGAVALRPAETILAASERDVLDALAAARRHGHPLRVIGGGHSFTPLAAADGILLSLDRQQGVVRVDAETGEVTLRAGTRLWQLRQLLEPFGLALANMGDIDKQSVGGAIATSTHGTGAAFTGYAAMVTGLRIALADGSIVDLSAQQEPELFEAARVNLGALGVVLEVTMRMVPRFRLALREETRPLRETVGGFLADCDRDDHREFYWFVGTDRTTVRITDRVPASTPRSRPHPVAEFLSREVLANGVWELACRAGSALPAARGPVAEIGSRLFAGAPFTDDSPRVFTAPCRVRFHESEWAIPAERFQEAFTALRERLAAERMRVTFPIEVRRVAADDVWLSTAHGRESVYIAAHQYYRQDATEYLRLVQEVMTSFEGRPHWGKMHWLRAEQLRPLYPRFDDFLTQRDRVDPDGVFLTPYLRSLLGR